MDHQGYFTFEKEGKVGLLFRSEAEGTETVLLPAEYDDIDFLDDEEQGISLFEEDGYKVILSKDGKYGFYYVMEDILIEPQYDDFCVLCGLAVRKGDTYGYIFLPEDPEDDWDWEFCESEDARNDFEEQERLREEMMF